MPAVSKRYYVVSHPKNQYSVQTRATGCGELLPVKFDNTSEAQATVACNAANHVLNDLGLLAPVGSYTLFGKITLEAKVPA